MFLKEPLYNSDRNHKASKNKSNKRGEDMFGENYKTI